MPHDVPADKEPLVVIARFNSVAEAGYFADELAGRDVTAVVEADQGFAMDGPATAFLLRVPANQARDATGRLRELVAASAAQPRRPGTSRQQPAAAVETSAGSAATGKVSLALAFAAGAGVLGMVVVLSKQVPRFDRAAAQGGFAELEVHLAESARPWRQALPRGTRELRFDQNAGVFVLRDDMDGDGVPEHSRRFRAQAARR